MTCFSDIESTTSFTMSVPTERLRNAVTEINNALRDYEASETDTLRSPEAQKKLYEASQTLNSLLQTPETHWASHVVRVCALYAFTLKTNTCSDNRTGDNPVLDSVGSIRWYAPGGRNCL